MGTATVTSKGQITIPSAIRNELHIGPGDRIEFIKVSDGRYEVIAAVNDVRQLRGIVKASKTVSVDEMKAAVLRKAGSK